MNPKQCTDNIGRHIGSSPCGAAFKYSNEEFVGNKPHIKIVVAHKNDMDHLYVVSATSKPISAFMHSSSIDDVHLITPNEYDQLSCDTYIICSDVEEIKLEQLIKKCTDASQYFELKPFVCQEILKDLQEKIVNSQHAIRGHKRAVLACM